MDLRFEEQNNGSYKVMQGDRQRGVVIPQEGGFGYSIFGSPHMGKEASLEDVQKTLERKLD